MPNFGVSGILLVLGIMTAQIAVLQLVFPRLPKAPVFLAIYVLFTERMVKYGSNSLQAVFAEQVVLVLATIALWYLCVRQVWDALAGPGRGRTPARAGAYA